MPILGVICQPQWGIPWLFQQARFFQVVNRHVRWWNPKGDSTRGSGRTSTSWYSEYAVSFSLYMIIYECQNKQNTRLYLCNLCCPWLCYAKLPDCNHINCWIGFCPNGLTAISIHRIDILPDLKRHISPPLSRPQPWPVFVLVHGLSEKWLGLSQFKGATGSNVSVGYSATVLRSFEFENSIHPSFVHRSSNITGFWLFANECLTNGKKSSRETALQRSRNLHRRLSWKSKTQLQISKERDAAIGAWKKNDDLCW